MDLILWRHADAEDGVPDLERRLTPKGRRQAERMAAWLERELPRDCRVLVSPATRAQQTALALNRPSATVDALAPGASVEDILDAAAWPDALTSVLVVGHQPTLGEVVAFLTGEGGDYPIRKAAVCWLSERVGDGGREALVKTMITPDSV
jgi:phosphohistidine phosphatase